MITVFIVDQNRSRRAECVRLLKSEDAILVIGQSRSAANGIILVSKFKPNIVIFDLDLALKHDRGLLSTIRRQSPRTKVILLMESFSPSRLLASFSYGALGCIRNRDIASSLIKAVRAVDVGEAWVPRSRSLRRELSLHLAIRNTLNRFHGADYDRLLDLLNEKTIQLLGIYNRDQAARILCRIVLAQPRLLTFGGLMPWRRKDKVIGDRPFAPQPF